MFCRHDYKLIDKEVIPPPFQTLNITRFKGEGGNELFQTTVIHIFQCSKCKKLKRLVTV